MVVMDMGIWIWGHGSNGYGSEGVKEDIGIWLYGGDRTYCIMT